MEGMIMVDSLERARIRDKIQAHHDRNWTLARRAYAVVAALTVAIALQTHGSTDIFRSVVVAIVALAVVPAAIALTDLILALCGYGGPEVWEFVTQFMREPIQRAVLVFFVAHGICLPPLAPNVAATIGLTALGYIVLYFQWSDARGQG
jgi:hypothetical protein